MAFIGCRYHQLWPKSQNLRAQYVDVVARHQRVNRVLLGMPADNVQSADPNRSSGAKNGERLQLPYYIVNRRNLVLMNFSWRSLILLAAGRTFSGAGGVC